MSEDAWDDMRRAKEEQYMERSNREALEKLSAQSNSRLESPVSGAPMATATVLGVDVSVCPTSGGVWIPREQLEKLIALNKSTEAGESKPDTLGEWLHQLWSTLTGQG
jgi:Zn-finger nucleic acid-binding protein